MQIVLNGEEASVEEGLNIAQLLEQEEEASDHVLVEVDGVYVPPAEYATRKLAPGQRVEIILPAFGG